MRPRITISSSAALAVPSAAGALNFDLKRFNKEHPITFEDLSLADCLSFPLSADVACVPNSEADCGEHQHISTVYVCRLWSLYC